MGTVKSITLRARPGTMDRSGMVLEQRYEVREVKRIKAMEALAPSEVDSIRASDVQDELS